MKNLKLIFSVFTPHESKEKISGSDFKIRATNFKIQATNFLPRENYIETYSKNADKCGSGLVFFFFVEKSK